MAINHQRIGLKTILEDPSGASWGQIRRIPILNKNTVIGGLIVLIVVLIVQLTSPQPATPVVFTPRPPLMQVDSKAVAKELLTTEQYKCLDKLLTRESHWNPKAKNPKSTASGIGQMLNSTYAGLGMKKQKAGISQLMATLAYISRRHVNPCNAWKHFQNKGWY